MDCYLPGSDFAVSFHGRLGRVQKPLVASHQDFKFGLLFTQISGVDRVVSRKRLMTPDRRGLRTEAGVPAGVGMMRYF